VSFVHCPTCHRAYNLVGSPACPACGVRAGAPADPTEDILVAADQLARAVARATPAQLAAAEVALASRTRHLALPSGDRPDHAAPPEMLRAVRAALLPAPEAPPRSAAQRARHLLVTAAGAISRRWPSIAERAGTWSQRARSLLAA